MSKLPDAKKIPGFKLVGLDGNAFNLMGTFRAAAEKAKWSEEDISAVIEECMSGDYDHLIATLLRYSKD